MITTHHPRSSPRHDLSNIKYKNQLRLKLMMLSGSGWIHLKPNSALMRQRLMLCLTLRGVFPTLKCPDSKCKLSSMQTAKHWGGCYSQMVMALGKTRSSKTKSTGHQHLGLLWGRNKMVAFLISCHYYSKTNLHLIQSQQSRSQTTRGKALRISLTSRWRST